jgi:DNA-directed RNA polymerase subunit RPC12/RpoP
MASMVESPASSCVSSDEEEEAAATKAMVVVGCPRCLMYVMLSEAEEQPRCPRCKSPVLLHFLDGPAAGAAENISSKRQGSKS